MGKKTTVKMNKAVIEDASLSVEARMIYAVLASKADGASELRIALSELLDCLGMSRYRFARHREQLIDAGLIEVEKDHTGAQGIEVTYKLI